MSYSIRKATLKDKPEIEKLIEESVRGLSGDDYDARQIELSIKTVFGVDTELIADETYFVAETETGEIAGCGGWSRRKTLYGASVYSASRDSELLDPESDAARPKKTGTVTTKKSLKRVISGRLSSRPTLICAANGKMPKQFIKTGSPRPHANIWVSTTRNKIRTPENRLRKFCRNEIVAHETHEKTKRLIYYNFK